MKYVVKWRIQFISHLHWHVQLLCRIRGGAAWLMCKNTTVSGTEERFYSTIWIINWVKNFSLFSLLFLSRPPSPSLLTHWLGDTEIQHYLVLHIHLKIKIKKWGFHSNAIDEPFWVPKETLEISVNSSLKKSLFFLLFLEWRIF